MSTQVEEIAFSGEKIIAPHLLDVDERALPLAKEKMLECGDREELIFGEHGLLMI
jgi:hypothetical protein